MSKLNYPLTNVQMELLKLFSTNISENELIDLKEVLVKFYAERSIPLADNIENDRSLIDMDMEKWLDENS